LLLVASIYVCVLGYTGASPHHRSTTQSPARSITDTRASLRTDAHGRPVKKVIHEVIV